MTTGSFLSPLVIEICSVYGMFTKEHEKEYVSPIFVMTEGILKLIDGIFEEGVSCLVDKVVLFTVNVVVDVSKSIGIADPVVMVGVEVDEVVFVIMAVVEDNGDEGFVVFSIVPGTDVVVSV